MQAAASDVSRLVLNLMGSQPPGAILGHSMGGKVALALVQQAAAAAASSEGLEVPAGAGRAASAAAGPPGGEWCAPPRQLWVLDSQPGTVSADQDAGTGVSRVLSTVHSIPLPVPNRSWLLRSLRERGLSEALATWLASNLVPWPPHPQTHPHQAPVPRQQLEDFVGGGHPHQQTGQHQDPHQQQHKHAGRQAGGTAAAGAGGPLTWSFDVQGASAMYMSYRTTNYWSVLEHPPPGTAVHLVQGDRSDRWPADMQRRLGEALNSNAAARHSHLPLRHPAPAHAVPVEAAPPGSSGAGAGLAGDSAGAASGPGGFHHHVLERAGHWLHVDNPDGLLRLVLPRLAGL